MGRAVAEVVNDGTGRRVAADAGHDHDFPTFFAQQYPAVVRLAAALTGDRHDAEDLAQDAFLAARERWSTISTYDNPGAWVRRVVTNRSVSRWRRLGNEAKTLVHLQQRASVQLPDGSAEVWDAVRRLAPRQAQVIVLSVLEDLRPAQVAAVLQCGEETVRTHLRRGRSRLALMLDESEEETP